MKTHTQASQSVNTIDVHGAATTDTFTARPTESQSRVHFVLYPDKSVQHHGSGFLQIKLVALHGGFLARLVRVPAVDLEGLHARVLRGNWVNGGSRLNGGVRAGEGGRAEERPRRSEQSRRCAERSHGGQK